MNKPDPSACLEQSSDNEQSILSRRAQETDRHKLHEAINSIDCMCQTQLGQIQNLTNVTLRAMESPSFWKCPMAVGEILGLILYIAADLANYVNCVDEEHGSNHVDEGERARNRRVMAAFREAGNRENGHA